MLSTGGAASEPCFEGLLPWRSSRGRWGGRLINEASCSLMFLTEPSKFSGFFLHFILFEKFVYVVNNTGGHCDRNDFFVLATLFKEILCRMQVLFDLAKHLK